ncbi:MAG: DNA-binding protein [Deltaproteobacteria bacterium RIFCSPLOWO2_02_FULL_44_10]|nr:MAG: DNA-binding protein [Deltaproteobacteria bacterium RIFCSPHIGHO2_02_FULL_44_16]OGQ47141.1 MAG: DNA-binding protein [Deltaproteobacteria bacterium RIFCSPLOWO2_02_FULL_44_10]
MKHQKIEIKNQLIAVTLSENEDNFISLTDMARYKNEDDPRYVIQNWMKTRFTVEFIGLWEQFHNENFNRVEFDTFKKEVGSNAFVLTPQKWIEKTNAIGIISKSGRYGGGTFAHKDIAFEFASWISAEFKLYMIKEFQRLKVEENERLILGWDAKRMLTKINYRIHTDAIKETIILPQKLSQADATIVYANEADVLNVALFGMTAKAWKDQNKNKEGNMRDYADVYQLVCLANLEGINAEFIRMGMSQKERLLKLNETAITQMKSLLLNSSVKKLLK